MSDTRTRMEQSFKQRANIIFECCLKCRAGCHLNWNEPSENCCLMLTTPQAKLRKNFFSNKSSFFVYSLKRDYNLILSGSLRSRQKFLIPECGTLPETYFKVWPVVTNDILKPK